MNPFEDDSSFDAYKEELVASLLSFTKSAKFLKPADVTFYRSDTKIATALDTISEKIFKTTNQTLQYSVKGGGNRFLSIDDVQDRYNIAIDPIDNLLEKADICLDQIRKSKQKNSKAVVLNENAKSFVSSTTKSFNLNIIKPQAKFKDPVDNSNKIWIPIIKHKPHALVPLPKYSVDSTPVHPYLTEIQNIEYPTFMFKKSTPIKYDSLEKTPLTWIDTLDSLKIMCSKLENVKEIAIDLEHHHIRSFQGFTCLIQISTRDEDYLVDTLELRSELHLLNESFTNPKIVKVLHGAEKDIVWLQRDFGVYIVNLFDTYHASNCLSLEHHSLAFLLQHYCDVDTDKRFQMADWRMRPLSPELSLYARKDTHYLLYIYDIMRNDLISLDEETDNMLRVTLDRSALTSLNTFEKPVYDIETGEGPGGWFTLLSKVPFKMNEENVGVFKAVHAWRNATARHEDESTEYVLPNHMLFDISRYMPVTGQDIVNGCTPCPGLVQLYNQELAQLIQQTIDDVRQKRSIKGDSNASLVTRTPTHTKFDKQETVVTTKTKSYIVYNAPTIGKSKPKKTNKIKLSLNNKSKLFGSILESERLPTGHKFAQSIYATLRLVAPAYLEDVDASPTKNQVKVTKEAPTIIEQSPKSVEKVKEDQPKVSKPESKRKLDDIVVIDDDDEDEVQIISSSKPTKQKQKLDSDRVEFEPFDYSKASDPLRKPKESKYDEYDPAIESLKEPTKVTWIY
ncbi:exosome nuclease subunit [Globomyces sp. JEL0801]|nr:exosome nuclease subunit [Globomyces sp. JEL0801]